MGAACPINDTRMSASVWYFWIPIQFRAHVSLVPPATLMCPAAFSTLKLALRHGLYSLHTSLGVRVESNISFKLSSCDCSCSIAETAPAMCTPMVLGRPFVSRDRCGVVMIGEVLSSREVEETNPIQRRRWTRLCPSPSRTRRGQQPEPRFQPSTTIMLRHALRYSNLTVRRAMHSSGRGLPSVSSRTVSTDVKHHPKSLPTLSMEGKVGITKNVQTLKDSLTGSKVCLVTGAARGLGLEFCRAFVQSYAMSLHLWISLCFIIS